MPKVSGTMIPKFSSAGVKICRFANLSSSVFCLLFPSQATVLSCLLLETSNSLIGIELSMDSKQTEKFNAFHDQVSVAKE